MKDRYENTNPSLPIKFLILCKQYLRCALLPYQLSKIIFDVAILLIYEADFCRTSRKLIQENLTKYMGKSATPYGDNDMRQSAHKKIFELSLDSPSYFFMHILPHLVISKVNLLSWYGNECKSCVILFEKCYCRE